LSLLSRPLYYSPSVEYPVPLSGGTARSLIILNFILIIIKIILKSSIILLKNVGRVKKVESGGEYAGIRDG
jgi:hypothetical protein